MAHLIPNAKQKFFDQDGNPLAGGKLYSYQAGTSTPLVTYQDALETTPNTNPIILDANGEATIFINNNGYKFVLKTPLDVVLWTVDNVRTFADGEVTTAVLADGSVTNQKLATDSVSTAKIQNVAVTTAKLDDGSVTTVKLHDDAVTTAKILDANVTTAKIADLAVTTAKIADSSITPAKLAWGTSYVASPVVSPSPFTVSTPAVVTDVPNLTVNITTNGRPVLVGLKPSSTYSSSNLWGSNSGSFVQFHFYIFRDGTQLVNYSFGDTGTPTLPSSAFTLFDVPAAGAHTYKFVCMLDSAGTVNVSNICLYAVQL